MQFSTLVTPHNIFFCCWNKKRGKKLRKWLKRKTGPRSLLQCKSFDGGSDLSRIWMGMVWKISAVCARLQLDDTEYDMNLQAKYVYIIISRKLNCGEGKQILSTTTKAKQQTRCNATFLFLWPVSREMCILSIDELSFSTAYYTVPIDRDNFELWHSLKCCFIAGAHKRRSKAERERERERKSIQINCKLCFETVHCE